MVCFKDVYPVAGEGDEPFAAEGVSGSLVVRRLKDGRHEAVGILFSGSGDDDVTMVLPIGRVLGALDATLVGGHNVPQPARRMRAIMA